MSNYVPPSLKISVSAPGMLNLPSYMDTGIISSTLPPVYPVGSSFDAWCAERAADIGVPGTYTANTYSSYELDLLSATLPGIGTLGTLGALDNVNWLLNNITPSATTYAETIYNKLYTGISYYNVTGLSANFTYGDVQQAISSLLGQSLPSDDVFLGSTDSVRITDIVNQANANGNGFVPDVTNGNPNDDKIAVILDTFVDSNNNGIRDSAETRVQPLIITVKSAALGNFVWEDLNANGVQDANEPGLADVTVNLVRDMNGDGDFLDANELLATKTTDDSGFYKFVGLTPGLNYQVQFTKPTKYVSFTKPDAIPPDTDATDSDANVSTGVTPVVVLTPGQYNDTIDAGLLKAAHLGDFVWEDKNANGVQDSGETGISNVTVNLKDANGNVVGTTMTDTNGLYGFDVLPGTYSVQVVAPANYFVSPKDAGSNDATDSDIDGTGVTGSYTLAPGDVNNTADAGLYRKAQLGDRVWLDANGNGQQDNGEANVANVKVNLLDDNGNIIATQQTNGSGNYLFTNLNPGTYSVQFVAPNGYQLTTKDTGADATDSDADTTTGKTGSYVLQSGDSNLTVDAGLLRVTPKIDIEKTTSGPSNSNPTAADYDNEDAANGAGVPILTPGTVVTWTYKVTNPGTTAFARSDVAIVDDNGTPGNTADDLSIANGKITYLSGDTGTVDFLSPGETWLYKATGVVQNLTTLGAASTFDFSGSSASDGADGNVRTFTAGSVSVHASAFSRDKTSGAWSQAWLGSYGGGLGVTDSSEGSGGNNTHTVDNMDGRDNYVMFEFDQNVVVDSAFLGYVVNDSDMKVWIGTRTNAYTSHDTLLSDADLTALGFTEVNTTTLTTTRLADLNAGNVSGNVLVIAADSTDTSPEDMFKIEKVTVNKAQAGVYENKATVTAPGATDSDLSHYKNPVAVATPKIDIEKTTSGTTNSNPTVADYDNEDAANGAGVPILKAGSDVTWTYKVTNTGNTAIAKSEIAIVDDNGTPGNTADDLSVANGKITYLSGDTGSDNLMSPGEAWLYKATGTVQNLTTLGAASTFDFSGSSASDGADGNVRTFTAGSVSVHASAFSRDKTSGAWSQAWLGSYGGGLGVTDSSEGSGSNNTHTVDNMGGRDNYVLFEFDQNVVVDSAFLGYVVNDSDMKVWIGTRSNAFTNHDALLSDADLTALGFTEVNTTTLTTTRLADLNAGNVSGNVLVIAADSTDTSPEDMFKIEKVTVNQVQSGVYENKATVTAQGATDSDLSHYKNPAAAALLAHIGDYVWEDTNANGVQNSGETGISGVTVKLMGVGADGLINTGDDVVVATTTTSTTGSYGFDVAAGTYAVQVVAPSGYTASPKDAAAATDATDSDVNAAGTTGGYTLKAGDINNTVDAGLYRKASVGDKVWDDMNHNNIQDASEPGIGSIRVKLIGAGADKVFGTADDTTANTTTDSNGNYKFSNLDPGSYKLEFDKANVMHYNASYGATYNMSDWKWAVKDTGSNDAIDSDVAGDAVAKTNVTLTDTFTLVSGQNDLTRDAGITPLVIDLDGNGIQTVSRANSAGAFDLFGNGAAVQSGWIAGGEGFLAVDKNGNGTIDDISELFGGTAKGAGFAQLAGYDSNGDGVVNVSDAAFAELRVWRDANGNHQTDDGELMTLTQAGVVGLDINYTELPFLDRQGNVHLERSSAAMSSGQSVDMTDVYFNVSAIDAAAAGVSLPGIANLLNQADLGSLFG